MNNLRASYKLFSQQNEDKLDIKIYLKIVSGFIKFLMDKVFEGYEVKLPGRLGSFYIRGKKVKPKLSPEGEVIGLAPDWGATNKMWASDPVAKENKTIAYCFNEHSGGLRYKIIWSKTNVNVRNKTFYSVKFSRNNKRNVVKQIKSGKEYITI